VLAHWVHVASWRAGVVTRDIGCSRVGPGRGADLPIVRTPGFLESDTVGHLARTD